MNQPDADADADDAMAADYVMGLLDDAEHAAAERRIETRMNIDWQDPDLYSSLCLLAGLTALMAIIREFRMRKPGWRKRAEPLDGLLRDRPSLTALNKLRNRFRRRLSPGEVQRLEQRSRTRL